MPQTNPYRTQVEPYRSPYEPEYQGEGENNGAFNPPREVQTFGNQGNNNTEPGQNRNENSGPSPWQKGQGSFRDWFTQLQGGNNSQDWLESVEGLLTQSGSRVTGANSLGERSKIWDPEANDWVRVIGAGEGHPVYINQGWGVSGPAGGAPPPGGIPGAAGAPNIPPGVSEELYKMLMARAKQGTAIDKNDPNIRQQADPYAAAQERARRNYLGDVAERSGPLANMRGEQRMAMERAGQASGLFESQLIGRELESRRNEIQHALDSLGARLSEDQRLALQRELGYLNDATSRYGISINGANQANQIGLGYSQLDWDMDPRNPKNMLRD